VQLSCILLIQSLTNHPGYDIYRPEMNDDLQKYFDYYAKGIKNGWEKTPRIRLSLLGFENGGGEAKTIIERPETSYPLEREQLRTLYLDASSRRLVEDKPEKEDGITYEAHHLTDSAVRRSSFLPRN
jgi:uncharacterized protein